MRERQVPAYIVCGGPSLTGFDFGRLSGKFHVALNRAYEACPDASIVYFTDDGFWRDHNKYILRHKGVIVRGLARLPRPEDRHSRVRLWKFTGGPGMDLEPGRLKHGTNSTHAAINLLAGHLGFKRIYLLGCDMGHNEKGATHWHSGYPNNNPTRIYENMKKNLATLVKPLEKLGCRVFNANPDSGLECFPKVDMETALSDRVLEGISE